MPVPVQVPVPAPARALVILELRAGRRPSQQPKQHSKRFATGARFFILLPLAMLTHPLLQVATVAVLGLLARGLSLSKRGALPDDSPIVLAAQSVLRSLVYWKEHPSATYVPDSEDEDSDDD